jgi:3-oxoacyl-[acyl-carrier protein] reductase
MRTALVTGASRGIGLACARALSEDGIAVALAYRSGRTEAEKAAAGIEESGGRAIAVRLDVTDTAQVDAAFAEITERLGAPLILVNNAGISRDGLLVRYGDDALEETLSTDLGGAFRCARAALRPMLQARWGRIVNVSSAVALRGNAGQTAYASAKAGLLGLTTSLAREVGGRGITVNAVCPGLIETELSAALPEPARAALIASTPAARMGTPEEVAAVVRFLAGDPASYVNGAVIAIDGGLTA